MAQRIAILGGTFDPVHIGHLVLATCAHQQLSADRLFLIPNLCSPLKSSLPIAAFADRYEMLRLAIGTATNLSVSDIEGRRAGVSYTIDTLRALRQEFPAGELFLVLGTDALADFAAWRDHDTVAREASLVAVQRAGDRLAPHAAVAHVVAMPRLDVSSSMIRARIAAGEPIDFLTPPDVVAYIHARGLYRTA